MSENNPGNSDKLPDPQPLAWNAESDSKWTQSAVGGPAPVAPSVAFSEYGKSVIAQGEKSLLIATLLSAVFFVTGVSGLHRFYAGKIGTGILQLVTLGGLGIWAIIDLIVLVTGNFRDANGNLVTSWQLPR